MAMLAGFWPERSLHEASQGWDAHCRQGHQASKDASTGRLAKSKPTLWAEEPSLDPAEPKFGVLDGDAVCALGIRGGGTSCSPPPRGPGWPHVVSGSLNKDQMEPRVPISPEGVTAAKGMAGLWAAPSS